MPPVETDELRVAARAVWPQVERHTRVGRSVRRHPPRRPNVVLEARPADRRELRVAVAVHLHFAFAVPVARVDRPDADRAPEEPPGPAQPLRDDEVTAHRRRVLPPERHVQVARVVGNRRLERVIDLVVEHRRARVPVRQLDADAVAKRHREVRVETAPFLHRRQRREVRHRPPVRQPEEVHHRHRDARLRRIPVVDLHPQAAHDVRRRRRERHPDVANRPRTLDVRQHHFLARRQYLRRRALAPAVSRAPGAARTRRVLEGGRARIQRAVDTGGVHASKHARECTTSPVQYGDRQRSESEPTAAAHRSRQRHHPHPALPPTPRRVSTATVSAAGGSRPRQPTAAPPARQPICAAWPRLRHHVDSVRRPSAQREGADRASPRQPRQHANPFAQPGLASGATSTQYGDRQRSVREPTAPAHGSPGGYPPLRSPRRNVESARRPSAQREGANRTNPRQPRQHANHFRGMASPPARRRVSTATVSAARGSRPRQPTARAGGITPPGCEAPAPSA